MDCDKFLRYDTGSGYESFTCPQIVLREYSETHEKRPIYAIIGNPEAISRAGAYVAALLYN